MILSHLDNLSEVLAFITLNKSYYADAARYLRSYQKGLPVILREPTSRPYPPLPRWMRCRRDVQLRAVNPSHEMIQALPAGTHLHEVYQHDSMTGTTKYAMALVTVGAWMHPMNSYEVDCFQRHSRGVRPVFANLDIRNPGGRFTNEERMRLGCTHLTTNAVDEDLDSIFFDQIRESFPNLVTLDIRSGRGRPVLDFGALPAGIRTLTIGADDIEIAAVAPENRPSLDCLNIRCRGIRNLEDIAEGITRVGQATFEGPYHLPVPTHDGWLPYAI